MKSVKMDFHDVDLNKNHKKVRKMETRFRYKKRKHEKS